ncbi:MAG: type I glyceraldehyde-3-phosphate dehydrogenase [Candidatus Harrisonbacteria bacterium CG10_big_fil_rev_8_21_14_0_10_40_38]|uniref:Type I glyceraldehyde-3-phosphate dehydrogenase n=1 Tax=Candidatus Harrisonbacteria bacterium CG10_big_fil_rev_8_21_14_0_10_40_38 TaxID=1974583 RepID=A0A2H0URM2_9BACT|nr:MAG: type I glyceraldehyde-3-phosphate dehydrogenase [Candidatus Harrisonbacteria bacterium CG10_big_fil_rev_8_21_14_0_10_40_38]
MAKIAINGFGRIGRMFFRQAAENKDIEIIAINDLGDAENLAYLLKYDTVYGRFDKDVSVKDGNLIIDGKTVKIVQEKDPEKLPWGAMGVDIVIESTGVFDSFEKSAAHIKAGAKRVIISAPAKDEDGDLGKTILMGINDGELKTVSLSSNASCTTNSASPVIQIMSENPGIEKAILSTVHGYTATQSIVDSPTKGKDFRRGRAAAQNIVPSTTGAAIAVTRAVKELKNKFDGISMRVPVPSGSIADITFIAKRNTTKEEVNDILRKASETPRWKGIIKVSEDQLVSSDIVGEPYGSIVDLGFTKVVDGNLVKVLSWYDNEYGYVAMLVKHVLVVSSIL